MVVILLVPYAINVSSSVQIKRQYLFLRQMIISLTNAPTEPRIPGQVVARGNFPIIFGLAEPTYFRCSQQIQPQISNARAKGIL